MDCSPEETQVPNISKVNGNISNWSSPFSFSFKARVSKENIVKNVFLELYIFLTTVYTTLRYSAAFRVILNIELLRPSRALYEIK